MGSSACSLILIICQDMSSASDWSPTLNGLSRRSSLARLIQKCQSKNNSRCANYVQISHMVPSLCPFSYLLPLSGKFLSLFWLSPPHTHKTQATPKSNEGFCFSRAPTPMPNPRSCFPRQAWDIWSVLKCSWGVVFPGMWFLALETDRSISHAMLPEEEGWESCLDEGRGRDKCRHRICGCGREKRWADNPGSLGDPCLQNILLP